MESPTAYAIGAPVAAELKDPVFVCSQEATHVTPYTTVKASAELLCGHCGNIKPEHGLFCVKCGSSRWVEEALPRIPSLQVYTQAKGAVRAYRGFTENAYRLSFICDEDQEYEVTTILPSGAVETKEVAKKGDRILSYPFPQELKLMTGVSSPIPSPFVWKRDDGSHALVQAWKTDGGESFSEAFGVEEAPNESDFSPQAVEEFRRAMGGLVEAARVKKIGEAAHSIGEAARVKKIECVHCSNISHDTAYVGKAEVLVRHLQENRKIREAMKIESVLNLGIRCKAFDHKGDTRRFVDLAFQDASTEYVLYMRRNNIESMACIATSHHFCSRDRYVAKMLGPSLNESSVEYE